MLCTLSCHKPAALHLQTMPSLSCTAHPMLGCATPRGAAAAPRQETTRRGERVLKHPWDSVLLPFCWPPAIKSLAGCRCAVGGTPVTTRCIADPPPGPLLPLNQQVYFTRSLQSHCVVSPRAAPWQVGSGTGWSGFVPAKGGQPCWSPGVGSPQDWRRDKCPSLWSHRVSRHRGGGHRALGAVSADANAACSARGAAGPCAQPP